MRSLPLNLLANMPSPSPNRRRKPTTPQSSTMVKSFAALPYAGQRVYRNGEQVEYTGRSCTDNGATLYELRVVADSYRVGAVLVTYNTPSDSNGGSLSNR